ncbi:uncharacterized protein [Periplaneta americana]|uniref:uncharacterized protein n=1 Tax=Periplaneta americana TaxID=6978 RepID=UPI0037E748F9
MLADKTIVTVIANMLTESSNPCQNHRHHHRHHRHHHKHHRRHARRKSNMEKSASRRLKTSPGEQDAASKAEPGDEGKLERRPHHPGRVLRNRRYRRPFEDHRHTKRLFTPEIKRFLKSWLVRRRDNPYPSRDEKKGLAVQTGLTYIQICNWFANWRRKLKNAGSEAQHRTWGTLIKSYNTQAQGNVEQFSLCSDDSIWEERELSSTEPDETDGVTSSTAPLSYVINAAAMDHSYSALFHHQNTEEIVQNHHSEQFSANAMPDDVQRQILVKERQPVLQEQTPVGCNNKYKNLIMEKYLTDLRTCNELSAEPVLRQRETKSMKRHRDVDGDSDEFEEKTDSNVDNEPVKNGCGGMARKCKRQKKEEDGHPLELSKWLESAAKFKPGQNYVTWAAKNVTWQSGSCEVKKSRRWNATAPNDRDNYWSMGQHHREELDAAEALTRLSTLHH